MIVIFIGLNVLSIIVICGVLYFVKRNRKNLGSFNDHQAKGFDNLSEINESNPDFIALALTAGALFVFVATGVLIYLYFSGSKILDFVR